MTCLEHELFQQKDRLKEGRVLAYVFFLILSASPNVHNELNLFLECPICSVLHLKQTRSPRILTSFLGKPFKWVVHLQDSCTCGFPGAISTLEFGKFCALCVCYCVFAMFLGTIFFPQKTIRCSKQARYKLSEAEPLFSRALEGRQRKLGVNHPDTWWKWSCFYVVKLNKLLLKHLQKWKISPQNAWVLKYEVWKCFPCSSTKNRRKKREWIWPKQKKDKRDSFSSKLRIFRILWRSWTTSLNYSRCLGWV